MLHLLREHIIGARFSYTVYGTTITNTQASLLSELACRETPAIEELCEVLKVNPSTISRTAQQLHTMGMISSNRSSADRRRMLHVCSKKGRAFAELTWSTRKEIIKKRLASFSRAEQAQLEDFLRAFVGDAAFSRVVPTDEEPLLATIFRALTYDHGVASGNYVGSGFSSSDWLILSEIHYNKRSHSELCKLMSAGKATVSLRLKSLATRGLSSSRKDPHDKRARILFLTDCGKRALRKIERLAEEYFNQALSRIPTSEQLHRGLALFRRYVFSLKRSQILTARVVSIQREELSGLRSAALQALSEYGPDYPASGYLFHHDNFTARIVASDAPPIVIECSRVDKQQLRLVNLVCLDRRSIPFSAAEIAEIVNAALNKPLLIAEAWGRYLAATQAKMGAPTASE